MSYKVFDDGFLDYSINEVVVKDNREKYKELYKIIFKYNKLGYETRKRFIGECEYIDVFLYTTFNSIHNSFQSCLLLLERGAFEDANIIFRSMYDKLIDLKFVLKDKNNFQYIYNDFIKKTLTKLNDIKKNKFFDLVAEKTIDDLMVEFKKYNKNMKKSLTIKNKADIVNMSKEYVYYRYLSEYTHNGLRVLYDNIIPKNDNLILDSGFKLEGFNNHIIIVIGCYKDALVDMCKYLNDVELIQQIDEIDQKLSAYFERQN